MLNISRNLPKLCEKNMCYLMTFKVLSAAPFTSHTHSVSLSKPVIYPSVFFSQYLRVRAHVLDAGSGWNESAKHLVLYVLAGVQLHRTNTHTQAHKIIVVANFSIHFRCIRRMHFCPEVSVWGLTQHQLRMNNSCCLL